VQSFKPRREVGRYRQAYVYLCRTCNKPVEPGWLPAAAAIDWSIPGERIGDRLKPKTRARIAAGIARYWGPLVLEAAGNTYDAADPNHPQHGSSTGTCRAWPVEEPLRALHTTNSKALAVPVEGRDGKDALSIDAVMRTQTTRAETALAHAPFIAEMYGTSTARSVNEPAGTFTAGGNHHGLVQHPFVTQFRQRDDRNIDPSVDPLHTIVADGASHALVQPYYGTAQSGRPDSDPLGTLTTRDRYALITRHNNNRGDQSNLTTPVDEYMRTLTTTAQQSIMRRPGPVSAADLRAAEDMVPEVLFRMFQPHEVAAGMAFPADYKWQPPDRNRPVSNRDLVKAAGNAVTPPAARDIVGAAVEALVA
jgi:DNA (cytosine-5)-methyltransferase 1